MATVRFISETIDETVSIDGMGDRQRTLLAVAREAGIPLLFNCGAGGCGACLVHVETLDTGARPMAPPTEPEQFLLQAMGLLPGNDETAGETNPAPVGYRLACQYEVRDECVVVTFDTALKGR